LASRIVTVGHLQIYTMSESKKEYDVFKGLLNGNQLNTLTSESILEVIRGQAVTALEEIETTKHLYVLHDGCDIRKPNSNDLEHLGKVMSLQKQVVNGYKTMNSVAVDIEGKSLNLLEHYTYSTGMTEYKTQEQIAAIAQASEIEIDQQGYLSNRSVYFQTVLNSHNTIKRANNAAQITHVQDREFDAEVYFEFVSDLEDTFITRLKLSRLSNETYPVYTPKGKISKKVACIKLIDKVFKYHVSYDISRISIKNKTYANVTSLIEWEPLVLNNRTYSVLRITLKDERGVPLFQHPMMLITNRLVETGEDAKCIYQAYLLRFKIEVVFRFLKTHLGWETFQVRDFQTIKNILAFAFFLVGYFKELKKDLQSHEVYQLIAQIGGAKGAISVHFLLKGIEKLVNFRQIQDLIDNNVLTKMEIDEALCNFT
jgi:hypothetical protein